MRQQTSSPDSLPAMSTNNSNNNINQQIKELQSSSDNPPPQHETKHETKTSSTSSTSTINSNSNTNIIFQAFAAGSIASSCCLFQLIINLLSSWNILHFGCAGFNGTLGPLRPYTRFITLAWLVRNWWISISISISINDAQENGERESESKKSTCCAKAGSNTGTGSRRRMVLVSSTILCLTLMFMPEMLEQWRHMRFQKGNGIGSGIGNLKNIKNVVKFEYVVDNMGCEACIHAVEKLVNEQMNIGVVRSKVSSFEMGEIDIYVDIDIGVGDRNIVNDSNGVNVDNGWRDRFEHELDGVLKEHGYELRPKGWVTKQMKLGMRQNLFQDQF